jgi:GTP cyclohydrolase I
VSQPATVSLPDVASHHTAMALGRIQRVGMEGIDLPICVRGPSGLLSRVPAAVDVFVSLDREKAKGIHMSRLFLAVQEVLTKEELNLENATRLLEMLVQSHHGLSRSAALAVHFDHLVERASLASEHSGWKRYPISLCSVLEEGCVRHEVDFRVTYSSTCPCSAALARQITRDHFVEYFGDRSSANVEEVEAWLTSEEGMPATPHSQRSFAELKVVLDSDLESIDFMELIDPVEAALGTPVQAAVKREDEQAFAELNGSNLMFCEDASRRIKSVFDKSRWIRDYRIEVRHEESLHPHDAVAILTKDVEGGLRP